MEADDGYAYVIKFSNNPQHRRILVNEWFGSRFLCSIGIAAPEPAIVYATAEFLEQNPEVHIQYGSRREAIEAGPHFGSRFPGDPGNLMVYDFLPRGLIARVENKRDFLGTLAFDQWLGQTDARQAIFFRERYRKRQPTAGADTHGSGFIAHMIDHGFIFGGPEWRLYDSPLHGMYFQPEVYHEVRTLDDFQPWLDRIVHFPEEVVERTFRAIPKEWLAGDADALERLLVLALRRRAQVPASLERLFHLERRIFSVVQGVHSSFLE